MTVELSKPNDADRAVIKNQFVFYRYELMPFFEPENVQAINESGIITMGQQTTHTEGVADLDVWWTKPGILLPMLIRVEGVPAGLAMVARPPHAHRMVDYRMEDFFVVNRWQRSGVGRAVVRQLFKTYLGVWEIGWLARNTPAAEFWRSVTSDFLVEEWTVEGEPSAPGIPGLRVKAGASDR